MKTITVAIALLFASCALFAQHSGGLVERLKRSDKNGDGKIDDGERAAIRERIRKRWQRPQSTTPLPPANVAAERLNRAYSPCGVLAESRRNLWLD